ncbi:MAG TPA: DUF4097 family beta strand repeat-containing protein [Terriglobales bacterium]|nr:DUF4097 family beta strand repeat-containing protein [Terriglobales bacterium]
MRRVALAILALGLMAVPFARADEWSKTYTISGKPDLHVDTSDANLRVDTWDKNTIEVHVTTKRYKIGEGGIKIIEHQNGDSVDLEVRYPHHVFTIEFGNSRVDVEIHMPREGQMNLHTGDGSIEVANFKGNMDLESGDGHQEITSADGTLRAKTGDGHITVSGRFDGLELTTGDGRIEARALPGSAMTSSWTLHTGDGSVRLQLPDNFAADVDLHTSDGHINLDFPITVEGRLGEKNIHGKINGGGNLLTVHTGDGSIEIEKS